MRRLLVAGFASLALFAAPAVAAPRLPAVLTQLTPAFQVRPSVISYTGDGTGIVGGSDGTSVRHPGHLHWTTYTDRRGAARGLVWLDDCTPNCAQGRFHSTPVSVSVFGAKRGHFTRLTLRYTYRGTHYTDRRGIRRLPGGSWAYYIIGG